MKDKIEYDEAGIIPAGAGSTRGSSRITSARRDHPRRCGEHASSPLPAAFAWGSSPQVRGAPDVVPGAPAVGGIIPAGAGSTGSTRARRPRRWDHPRRCGEHALMLSTLPTVLGSSPQVRGALAVLHGHDVAVGIIPAGAGSTPPPARGRDREGDHPRRCGEHPCRGRGDVPHPGSSPQVRGAPLAERPPVPDGGIIPAGAGSTPVTAGSPGRARDHPRRCGEH